MFPRLLFVIAGALAACGHGRAAEHVHVHPTATPVRADVGFIVAAPDRGFLGNEEVADAVAGFAASHVASTVFVTDGRTVENLRTAVADVTTRGARRVVILPLFLSQAEHGYRELERAVAKLDSGPPVSIGGRFGASYLAVELLADRLRASHVAPGQHVLIAGYGAADEGARAVLDRDLETIATAAATGFELGSIDVVVWRDRDASPAGGRDIVADDALAAALAAHPSAIVVPFQLGPKLDSMMTFPAGLAGRVGGEARVAGGEITPDPLVTLWMAREANRHVPVGEDEIGVVMLAHGSDHHWNQGMRDAVAKLAGRYDIEFAFSMADQPVVERAIRKLEARGARAIVVVRVFGLHSSFRASVEQMLGLDVEGGGVTSAHAHGGAHGHGHGGHGHGAGHGASAGPPPRIRSASLFATEGGLEDSARFADALLDRARELSKDPARETILLVAHGTGDDAMNEHWRSVLGALAAKMRAGDGATFRAIRVGTWREDWPGKREPEIAAIRAMVEEASKDGGRALVIPARTTAQGPEHEFLGGLTFELGSGFAPHPQFEAWFEDQIAAGVARLRGSDEHAHHAHHAHH